LALGLSYSASAAPKTYSYNDAGAPGGPYAGSGVFTIDIVGGLGEYTSSSASGLGDAFGVWNSVTFRANLGDQPGIVISNLNFSSIATHRPASGGGVLEFGISAADEWEHLLQVLGSEGYQIAEIRTVVPEASTWLSVAGLGAAGALALRRRSSKS